MDTVSEKSLSVESDKAIPADSREECLIFILRFLGSERHPPVLDRSRSDEEYLFSI